MKFLFSTFCILRRPPKDVCMSVSYTIVYCCRFVSLSLSLRLCLSVSLQSDLVSFSFPWPLYGIFLIPCYFLFISCVLPYIRRIYTHHITICPIESSRCHYALFLLLAVFAHCVQSKVMRIEQGEKEQEKTRVKRHFIRSVHIFMLCTHSFYGIFRVQYRYIACAIFRA